MSEVLAKTIKKTNNETTESLLIKAGYIHKTNSGIYTLLEFGQIVANNISSVIREELSNIGAGEIAINQIQSQDLWDITNRSTSYGNEMYKIQDRKGKNFVLSATNEEVITSIANTRIHSYKDLTKSVFCINNKFRDELRANNGLIRTKEFLMMDAYSFDIDKEELDISYALFKQAFINIFNRLGLTYRIESSDTGEVGGSYSEEFIAQTSIGDIEIGHIFKLDDKYSDALNAKFADKDNQLKNIIMGCYGIGITRLIQVIADQFKIDHCLGWSDEAIAFKTAIIIHDIHSESQQQKLSDFLQLNNQGQSILIDDRDISIGKKINDMKLMGFHDFIIIGNQ